MKLLDRFIRDLEQYGAKGIVLRSGQNISLCFNEGNRFAAETTSYNELRNIVHEIFGETVLKRGEKKHSTYVHKNQNYDIQIESDGNKLVVFISKLESPLEPLNDNDEYSFSGQLPRPDLSQYSNILEKILVTAASLGASDLHLNSGKIPYLRVDGTIRPLSKLDPIADEHFSRALATLISEDILIRVQEGETVEFSLTLEKIAHFRVQLHQHDKKWSCSFRIIPLKVPLPSDLQIPDTVVNLTAETGLILIAGSSGYGKSTSVAALLSHINDHSARLIISLETPTEFVIPDNRSLISQRNSKRDNHAICDALREDCDVLYVGEFDSPALIRASLEAAESGHLIIATVRAGTTISAIERLIHSFPVSERDYITSLVADSLSGVLSQVLCTKSEGGVTGAYEVLINTSTASALIRDQNFHQLKSLMLTGKAGGMRTINRSLIRLVKSGIIDANEAHRAAPNSNDFEKIFKYAIGK